MTGLAQSAPPALHPALRAVAAQGVERRYRRGTVIIEQGDPGGTLYFIDAGLVRAYTARADGQEFTFGFYGPGEYLGEMSLDGGPRSASVIVEEPLTCRMLTRETLLRAIAADPELAFVLMAKVIERARALSARASDLALDSAYGRLVKLLHDVAGPAPDGTRLTRRALTQVELAQHVGCSRPMITRLLGDLVKGGYLRQEDRHWRLMRPLPPKW
jgi:CRP/FNR family cyclic AMP-dependent transcriptional regulator